jgi:hypothetical protein
MNSNLCPEKISALVKLFREIDIPMELINIILILMVKSPSTIRKNRRIIAFDRYNEWTHMGHYLSGCHCCSKINSYPLANNALCTTLKIMMNTADPVIFEQFNSYPYEIYFLQKQNVLLYGSCGPIHHSIYIFAQINMFNKANIRILPFRKKHSYLIKHVSQTDIIEKLKRTLPLRTDNENLNHIIFSIQNDEDYIYGISL